MYMECSCSFVCSSIRTDINCRNSSRIMSIHDWRASILSMAWRMARHTVFTLRVCGVLMMSVNPCEMSDTQTKAVFVIILVSASSKPSNPLTLQKVKFFLQLQSHSAVSVYSLSRRWDVSTVTFSLRRIILTMVQLHSDIMERHSTKYSSTSEFRSRISTTTSLHLCLIRQRILSLKKQ